MFDYQEIIIMAAEIIRVALPIGVILSLTEWAVSFFMKNVLGKWGHKYE